MAILHRTIGLALAAAIAGASLIGCSPLSHRSGTSSGGGSDDTPRRPEYRLGYQLQWQGFPRVASRKGPEFFDVLGDAVVVQDHNNNLSVLETATGRTRWAGVVGKHLDNFVGNARVKDRLLVSEDTSVLQFDIKTGQLIDDQRLAYLANTRPIVVDAMAIYGCTTGEVLAHNLATGFKQWAYGLRGTIIARPVQLEGLEIAAVSDAGDVVILDAENATAHGRIQSIFDGLDNDPVADDFAVYLASRDQSVYAFARENGARLWRYRTEYPITAQPTVHDGVLYVHVPHEGMIALNTRSGERMWANPDAKGQVVALRNGRLLAWDGNAFTVLDPTRGETIETVVFPDAFMVQFDRFADGTMYTISRRGLTQKFAPAY